MKDKQYRTPLMYNKKCKYVLGLYIKKKESFKLLVFHNFHNR